MGDHVGENLLRLMARLDLSVSEVAERTDLDERTVRGIVRGTNRPQARSLHRLAVGLGVPVDEFFLAPSQLLYRRFDRVTNPTVDELLGEQPGLFEGWGEADFDELHSRVGAGGAMTPEGALAAVQAMNRKRRLHDQLDVLLESSQADLVAEILDVAYRKVVVEES
jgi:transcriptional regulator with XRE-family HTH domain